MQLSKQTTDYQNKLAQYCRSGKEIILPGTNNNLREYRRLIFNVMHGNFVSSFPILHQVVSDEVFNDMVNDYFINHNSQTPQVWKLAEEIYQYAAEANWKEKYDLPWLGDLLLVEYMESKIFTMSDTTLPNHVPLINHLDEPLAITSEFELLKLEYPVHLFPIDQCSDKKDTYNVLIYRHPETNLVHFIDLNSIYAALISELYRTKLSVHQILSQSIDSDQSIDQSFLNSIHHFIEHLYQQQFILGRLID